MCKQCVLFAERIEALKHIVEVQRKVIAHSENQATPLTPKARAAKAAKLDGFADAEGETDVLQ
jgi:hypothetical protein